ncbi:hypothetical protein CLV76_1381 [Marivita geojedonensis]|nr:hypothetical protein CLV76_1381 [Marivita geojedonensis]
MAHLFWLDCEILHHIKHIFPKALGCSAEKLVSYRDPL